jgi:Arc/MetJ-type ribon-helix-helix transcriptional regulator
MAKTVKVTVSMPAEDVARLRALDAAGAIESVSGYVAAAVHDRLARQVWLERWRVVAGEPDPEAVAWADEVIDRHFGGASRRQAS